MVPTNEGVADPGSGDPDNPSPLAGTDDGEDQETIRKDQPEEDDKDGKDWKSKSLWMLVGPGAGIIVVAFIAYMALGKSARWPILLLILAFFGYSAWVVYKQ